MAFAHERFMVPWVTVREAGGKDRLQKLVLTFICAAGEIVRIRSTPTCECATATLFSRFRHIPGFHFNSVFACLAGKESHVELSCFCYVYGITCVVTLGPS